MGTVYKARHRLMERTVAVKIINPHLVNKPAMAERFRREVTAAARLSHPNIVAAFDADRAGDTHFLVMEYVDGVPLNRVLAEHGRLAVPRACDYARQAALGLQHAFERGMVHRDIKPHNLMLTPEGRVKILDFGLARYASETVWAEALADCLSAPPSEVPESPSGILRRASPDGFTSAYKGLGTPDYMAPEEGLDARRADIRADIYSLGCTLYHVLAGQVPFPSGNHCEKLADHLERAAVPLDRVREGVPPGLATVVGRMMAKAPADRFQTPAEVVRALGPFTGPESRRVLVVEDDPDARASLVAVLRGQGFEVDTADDGREALAKLRAGPYPSLILLDLLMPVMDGWKFLEEQRRDPALAAVPVVIVSAADPRQARAAALGAADYLQKPIDVDDMAARVRRHVGDR
jgi:serine/threonine protein kinase